MKRETDPVLKHIHQVNVKFSERYIDLLIRDARSEDYLGNVSALVRDIVCWHYKDDKRKVEKESGE